MTLSFEIHVHHLPSSTYKLSEVTEVLLAYCLVFDVEGGYIHSSEYMYQRA